MSSVGSASKTPNDVYLQPATGAGAVILHNVGAGNLADGSADAVNGGQFHTLATNLATALGGGATFDSNSGALTSPSYSVQGQNYTNVGDALTAIDGNLSNIQGRLNNLESVVAQVQQQVVKNRQIAASGVAGVAAMSQIRYNDSPGKITLGLGIGNFDSQTAVAVGLGGTSVDGRVRVNASFGYTPGLYKVTTGAGISYSW